MRSIRISVDVSEQLLMRDRVRFAEREKEAVFAHYGSEICPRNPRNFLSKQRRNPKVAPDIVPSPMLRHTPRQYSTSRGIYECFHRAD